LKPFDLKIFESNFAKYPGKLSDLLFCINLYFFQVLFVIAAIVGAYVSSNLSESYGTVNGVSIPLSFSGGALMIIGARLAGGCTRYLLFIHN